MQIFFQYTIDENALCEIFSCKMYLKFKIVEIYERHIKNNPSSVLQNYLFYGIGKADYYPKCGKPE